jgi:hypothetical protein
MTAGLSRRALLPAVVGAGMAGLALPVAAQTAASGPLDDAPATTLEPGVHRVDRNLTLRGDLLVLPGATIDIAAGRTLTVLGSVIAPVAPIFTGAGRIDLNRSRVPEAHPEWWGAAPGDGSRDSLPALVACLAAHPAMRLLAADYFLSATLIVERPFCRIVGAGGGGTDTGQGTRLIVTDPRADVMRLGPARRPATVNDFLHHVTVRDVALCRAVAVDTAGGAQPAGLRAQFLLFAQVERVSAPEHAVGFVARGLVRSMLVDCIAFRSLRGRQDTAPWRGFLLDGSEDIGLAGGNASLFLTDCNATIGGDPRIDDGVGLLLVGAFADSFVNGFETAGVATGIRVDGRAGALGARARNGHVNLHLTRAVIDQCAAAGIEIRDTDAHAAIDITDPYVAVAGGGGPAIHLDRMRGAATITGGQFIGNTDAAGGGRAIGLAAEDSGGIQVHGLKIIDHAQPVRLARCTGVALHLLVANLGSRPRGAAIGLSDCEGGTAAVLLSGTDRAFAAGVRIEGRTTRWRIDATNLSPRAVEHRVTIGDRALALPFRDADLIVEGG